MTERITSRKNPLLEHVRKLDSAAYRRQTGTFLCDSPKLVDEDLTFTYEEIKYTKYLISFK